MRLLDRPEDGPRQHHRPDRMQPVLEPGGDAKVAAAAPLSPEQLGVALGVDVQHFTVGRD